MGEGASASRAARRRGQRIARFPWTTDLNPYQGLLYRELEGFGCSLVPAADFTLRWLLRSRGQVDVLHFHWRLERCYRKSGKLARWPAAYLQAAGFVLRLLVARALGYRVAWTLHELYRQVRVSRRLERFVGRLLGRLAHLVWVHDAEGAASARAELKIPEGKLRVVPHPSYLGIYPPGASRSAARRRLGVPEGAFTLLYFGMLRADKQTEVLLEAVRRLERRDVSVVIAGSVRDPETAQACEDAARCDPRIDLRLEAIPDERVGDLFAATDVFVTPQGDGWTSGSLILALSMGVPAIAADCPAYRRLLGDGEAGWTFHARDPDSLAEALRAAARDPEAVRAKAAAAIERAEALPDWSDLARRTAVALGALEAPEEPAQEPAPVEAAERQLGLGRQAA